MTDGLLRLFRVQPAAFRVLVRAFWSMSLRTPSSLIMQRAGRGENSLWKAWLLYAFFGLMVGVLAFTGMPRAIYGVVVSLSALFLIGMAVVADFAVFVMAPGDDEVLFHRPIRSGTYLAARLAVAGLHVSLLALFYGLVPALTSLRWGEPLYAPLLLLALVATGLFALVLAFGTYRVGLRMLGGERLRGALTYLPALFSILSFLLPQLLIGNIRHVDWARMDPYLDFVPPAWFVALPEVVLGDHRVEVLRRAALGLLILPVAYWILVAALGRGFLQDLLGLVSARGDSKGAPAAGRRPLPGSRGRGLAAEERAGTLLYTGAMRSRDARTRAAPILLMPFAFLLIGFLRPTGGAFNGIVSIYLLAAGAGTLLGMSIYHEHHAAAWIYGAVPLRRYGQFVRGVVRAMLLRHLLPAFAVAFAVTVIARPDWVTAAGALHAFAGGCLSIPFLAGRMRQVPFSRAFRPAEQTAQMGLYLVSMMLVGLVGGLHALVAASSPAAFAVTIPAFVYLGVVWMRAVVADLDAHPPPPIGALGAPPRRPREPAAPRAKPPEARSAL